MVKILVVSHGPLAGSIKESARMFFGDAVECISTLGLFPGDDPESLHEKIVNQIREIDEGDGVFIFVDILSGTPYNMTAMAIAEESAEHKLACFSGVNLPLLMEVLGGTSYQSLDEIVSHVEEIYPTTVTNLRKALEI